MSKLFIYTMAVAVIAVSSVSATIINVPADYVTIQAGIDASSNGDTVLVQPGIYVENINFNGHSIVLGSLFLTTDDTSFISQTIIDGDSSGTVVSIISGEDSTTTIVGFTIQNGCRFMNGGSAIYIFSSSASIYKNNIVNNLVTFMHSGVISIWNSSVLIKDNNISDNNASNICSGAIEIFLSDNLIISGNTISSNELGGIISGENSNILIMNNIIDNNHSNCDGGGIHSYGDDDIIIAGNIISNNTDSSAEFYSGGGGIYIGDYTNADIINNVIISNSTNRSGGGICILSGAPPTIINCIIRDNSADDGGDQIHGNATISYCNIEIDFTGISNIDVDPLFRNPVHHDYHLMSIDCGDPYNSPCIDAGAPYITDGLMNCSWGLGTERSDMGAFGGSNDLVGYGLIEGIVTQADTSLPISGVIVQNLTLVHQDTTDVDGYYKLYCNETGLNDISFSHEDYYDTIIYDVSVFLNDTITLDISMFELPGYLSGYVSDSVYAPIESTFVELSGDTTLTAYSDENGYFEFCLKAGIYDVSFLYSDYLDTNYYNIEVTPGDTTSLIVTKQILGVISGVISNALLELLENVYVEVVGYPTINDTTGSDGFYLLDNFIEGSYDVAFYSPEYCDTVITNVAAVFRDTTDLDVIFYVSSSAITGNVIDFLSAIPIDSVSVTSLNSPSLTVLTDTYGNYTLNLCEGIHDIIFTKPGYNDFIHSDVVISVDEMLTLNAAMMPIAEDLLYTWAGGTIDEYGWHDTIDVIPDTWINIPVYLMGSSPDVYIANMCLPLGINLTYVDEFDPGACHYYYPITTWGDASFSNENCNPPLPEGWCSLSFVGFADVGPPPGLVWGHWETPTIGFTFRVHVADVEIENDTVIFDAIGVGNDPYQPPNGGDTCGGAGYQIIDNWACLHFTKSLYLPGDVNMFLGIWPPMVIGGDVTYLVNFFKGSLSSQQCLLNDFWCSADANGDCLVMGSDVVKLSRYFSGEDSISYCPDYPPSWFTTDDIPDDQPAGWPPCE